jgi:enoyl-CoA hydratase/carnithine racemase
VSADAVSSAGTTPGASEGQSVQAAVGDVDVEMAAAGLRWNVRGEVATITLSRPERRNAMTPTMWHGLAEIGGRIPDPVRVVVVRGDGPSFCAGIDLRLFSPEGLPGEDRVVAGPGADEAIAGYQAGFMWLRDPAFVSIAAVQGHAIGAGFQLALACDLRILADDAMLCMREPRLGLVPDLTGTKPLVEIVGLARAIELCVTSRTVAADEAAQLRLAEFLVPRDQLDARVDALVGDLLTCNKAAARETKALLAQAAGHTLEQQAAAERAAQTRLLETRASE